MPIAKKSEMWYTHHTLLDLPPEYVITYNS